MFSESHQTVLLINVGSKISINTHHSLNAFFCDLTTCVFLIYQNKDVDCSFFEMYHLTSHKCYTINLKSMFVFCVVW